jgi:hypothetical protein
MQFTLPIVHYSIRLHTGLRTAITYLEPLCEAHMSWDDLHSSLLFRLSPS